MLLETILNRCHKSKGFVYRTSRFSTRRGKTIIEIPVDSAKNRPGRCHRCLTEGPTYDHLPERRFQFVPLWNYPVYLLYAPRRIDCPEHGPTVEAMPWASGKSPVCTVFRIFLAQWAKHLSWTQVARSFGVTWDTVRDAVSYVVAYGLAHRNLDSIKSIGVDEICYQAGKFLTLVYQLDAGGRRLLYVGDSRKAKTLLRFFFKLGPERCRGIAATCSDLWKPYLKVLKKKVPAALMVLDRFHIMQYLNDAIDTIRRQETHELKRKGRAPLLENSRWCILKNKENQTEKQLARLSVLLRHNLKTTRGFLLKVALLPFWESTTVAEADQFLSSWINRVMRSRLEPLKKVAKRFRRHKQLLLNWFLLTPRISNGISEGFNLKAKLTMRKSYGFHHYRTIELALYHTLGNLPAPPLTHEFC